MPKDLNSSNRALVLASGSAATSISDMAHIPSITVPLRYSTLPRPIPPMAKTGMWI